MVFKKKQVCGQIFEFYSTDRQTVKISSKIFSMDKVSIYELLKTTQEDMLLKLAQLIFVQS